MKQNTQKKTGGCKAAKLDRQFELEKKLRELKWDEACEYYFPGTWRLYPECWQSLIKIVFFDWLQKHVDGEPFTPLLCCCH